MIEQMDFMLEDTNLNDTVLIRYLKYFKFLSQCSHKIISSPLKDADIFFNQYYWFNKYKERYYSLYGPDEGLEQQNYRLLEDYGNRLDGTFDWKIVERIEKKTRIESIIDHYQSKGDFLYSSPKDEEIIAVEKRLCINLPGDFKWFLKKYGYGGIDGIEILGFGLNNVFAFENATLRFRKYGLNDQYVVVENCDEWVYCIDTNTEKVVMWFTANESEEVFKGFLDFFLDRMNDVIENL